MAWLSVHTGESTTRLEAIDVAQEDSIPNKVRIYHQLTTTICVSVQWEVPPDYINVILSIKDNLTKDLVYILMAKGLHCISIKVC